LSCQSLTEKRLGRAIRSLARAVVLASLLFLLLTAFARPAGAQDPAEPIYRQAEADEQAGDYARALDEYRAAFAAAPSSRYAPRAVTRADWLRAHSEGDFAPLTRLEGVRHGPAGARDPAQIEALARDLEAFPPGNVRVEARLFVAEAYLTEPGRHADALSEMDRALDEPKIDPLTARATARRLVDERLASGDLDGAIAEARARRALLEASYVKTVERRRVRRALDRVALADCAAVIALAGVALALAKRRGRLAAVAEATKRAAPIALLFAAYVGLAGGYLASKYESGNATPFYLLAAALFPIVLLARAWAAAGSPRPAARAARVVLCGACALAVAFLVLEKLDPVYLDGFGL
jgi:hypothetical protein